MNRFLISAGILLAFAAVAPAQTFEVVGKDGKPLADKPRPKRDAKAGEAKPVTSAAPAPALPKPAAASKSKPTQAARKKPAKPTAVAAAKPAVEPARENTAAPELTAPAPAQPAAPEPSPEPVVSLDTTSAESVQLQARLQNALRSEPSLSSENLTVTVTDYKIEIGGSVGTGKDKVTAERLAHSFAGNRRLTGNITVRERPADLTQVTRK